MLVAITGPHQQCFSALQRAEIAEIDCFSLRFGQRDGFSALQRAEIAEIETVVQMLAKVLEVSVLFNEPKLLKFWFPPFSIKIEPKFQCSSTSRNC